MIVQALRHLLRLVCTFIYLLIDQHMISSTSCAAVDYAGSA